MYRRNGVEITVGRNLEKYTERVRNIPFKDYPLAMSFDFVASKAHLRENAIEALTGIPKSTAKYRTTRYSSYSGSTLTSYFNDERLADRLGRAVLPDETGFTYYAGMAIRAPINEYLPNEQRRLCTQLGCTKKVFRTMVGKLPNVVRPHLR